MLGRALYNPAAIYLFKVTMETKYEILSKLTI